MKARYTLWLAGLLLASCVSYSPAPINLQKDTAEWQALSAQLCAQGALSRADVYRIGLQLNPELNSARLAYAGSTQVAKYAGLWDDPSVSVGIERVLHERTINHSIAPSLSIPVTGSKYLAKKVAEQYKEADFWKMREKERAYLQELDSLYNGLLVGNARLALMRGRLAQARSEKEQAEKLHSLGEIPFADYQAVSSRLQELVTAEQEQANSQLEAKLKLLRALGLHPSVELPSPAEGLPASVPAPVAAPGGAELVNHPALLAENAAYGASELELKSEIRKQYPDLELGLSGGKDDGDTELGINLGLTLPLWNRNRSAIHKANADRAAARNSVLTVWRGLLQDAAALAGRQALEYSHCLAEQGRVAELQAAAEKQERLFAIGEIALPALAGARQEAYTRRLNYLDCLASLLEIRSSLQAMHPNHFDK
ncbi:MAG: TolC family protein [Akkermansia sp.]|nr:TolC family protein [Akkermansia sp.]